MMGVAALSLPPRATAAGALVLASRHVLRQAGAEMGSEELFDMVELASAPNLDQRITREQLRHAVEGIVAVPRLWKEVCQGSPLGAR